MLSHGLRHTSGEGTQRGFLSFAVGLLTVFALAACQPSMTPGIELGEQTSGIVNGVEATGSEPFITSVVGIASKKPDGQFAIFCSGTLISENIVVTAAHCLPHVTPNEHYVVFGLNEQNLQARRIVRKAAHDKYINWFPATAKDVYDIGLVQFSGGLPLGYRPMPMLPDDSILQPGTEVLMVGYGVNNGMSQTGSGILRYTFIRIADHHGLTEVKTDELQSGTCNGDSGGPGLIYWNGQYYLWGATSRGDARCRNHGIYTKATAYRSWIEQKHLEWNTFVAEDEIAASQPVNSYAVGW